MSALGVLLTGPVSDGDQMTDRILDAALDELVQFGLRRFAVEDVARRAGINRITIYRRFTGRHELLQAVIVREGRRLFALVDSTIAGLPPAEQLEEGFAAVLLGARRHPLLQRVLTAEPETLASLMMTHGGTVVAVAREYLADHVRRAQRTGHLGPFDPAGMAELAVRLSLSFLMMPQSHIPLQTADDARAFAREYLLPALGAPRPASRRRA